MPLRDHFRPPLADHFNWEGVHGAWPTFMIQHLNQRLPDDFVAEPRVHLGSQFEGDIGTFEKDASISSEAREAQDNGSAIAWSPDTPVLTVETDFVEPSEYEVLVYDITRARRLVAAIAIVSPANKDRPEHRRAFVAKCAAMLQQQVSVSIVDIVTIRRFNLYAELMELIDRPDPAFGGDVPDLYAVTCQGRKADSRTFLDLCPFALRLGEPLPTLPIWLREDLTIPLDLNASYDDTCRMLRIR
jgi:hypothetical protein